jgi:chemotaxis protein methyltransferase CheR
MSEITAPGMIQITDSEFSDIARLVHERFGIALGEKKKALVRGRLSSLLRSGGYANFGEYYKSISADQSGRSLLTLVDRISTNHSYFFREADHFDYLVSEVLPLMERRMAGTRNARLHIWSAGSAAGEEPYTLAMILSEYLAEHRPGWTAAILATDISTGALEQARIGHYSETKVAAVPAHYRKYFTRLEGDQYGMNDSIKNMVTFRRLNLMQEQYPFKSRFHVVFCRNVMIYFDQETKMALASRIARNVHDGGFFFIGHSETLGRVPGDWTYVRPTVYQR